MTSLNPRPALLLTLPLALGLALGCNKMPSQAAAPAPTDQQVAVDVQAKILGDSAVSNKQMNIVAANGVVTLSGEVLSDAERAAAAGDASSVAGVKTVVNNLTVSTSAAQNFAAQETPAPAPVSAPVVAARKPSPRPRREAAPVSSARNHTPDPVKSYSDSNNANGQSAPPPPVAQNTTPQPPPPPAKITVPSGTGLSARLSQPLASDTANQGDIFQAVLQSPIVVDDQVVIPQGATLEGRVVSVQRGGKFGGTPGLALTLYSLKYNGHHYNIDTDQWSKEGSSRTKNSVAKVGGGAAVGAILGGIFGGGKGAAIGAAAGGGAGGAAQELSKAPQVRLDSEAVLSFRLQNPITVSPANTNNIPERRRLDLPQQP